MAKYSDRNYLSVDVDEEPVFEDYSECSSDADESDESDESDDKSGQEDSSEEGDVRIEVPPPPYNKKSSKCSELAKILRSPHLILGMLFCLINVTLIVALAVFLDFNNGKVEKLMDQNRNKIIFLEQQLNTVVDKIRALEKLNKMLNANWTGGAKLPPGFHQIQSSCSAIKLSNETKESGYYRIKSSSGQLRSVYCRMEGCGSQGGAWMRVANLNLDNCSARLKPKTYNDSFKMCIVEKDEPGCTELDFSSLDVPYMKVCGRIQAYSIGTLDGFERNQSMAPHENYVDGISITSGDKHIWTFAGGKCDCNETSSKPSFVGQHWTCTNPGPRCLKPQRFCDSPILWGSQQCGASVDWFNHMSMTDHYGNVQVKICRDQSRTNEDVALKAMEIYVQ